MSRHAYCILAHGEPELLKILVELIDDERNDIYIHIDAKSDMSLFAGVVAKKSNLVWIKRISTNWGGINLVRAELMLLLAARQKEKYGYYHLLSGVDLPLKTQDEIHKRLDCTPKKEYVALSIGEENTLDIVRRTQYRYLFVEQFRSKNIYIRKICSGIRNCFLTIQRYLGWQQTFKYRVVKGNQWFSITDGFCAYLLERISDVIGEFKYTVAPDELAIQSVFASSPFFKDCAETDLRAIDWQRGRPYIWKTEDWEELKRSDRLFARKFSTDDMEIVRRIQSWCHC